MEVIMIIHCATEYCVSLCRTISVVQVSTSMQIQLVESVENM